MEFLPVGFMVVVVAVFGLIIGSFLDVVVTRFHTGKSIQGRSRCMSCGHTLSWYELFPVLSYLLLKGRCRACGSAIPKELFFMELATASIFVFVYFSIDTFLELLVGLCLSSLLIVIALYDMKHMVIPHEFVFSVLALAVVSIGAQHNFIFDTTALTLHLFSAAGVSFFYASLWVISKGRWIGLGDAKLAFPLALMLYPFEAFSLVVLSFWIGAGLSLLLLGLQRLLLSGKKHLPILSVPLTIKSEVPFAPFMIVAFMLVFFQHVNVMNIMMYLF